MASTTTVPDRTSIPKATPPPNGIYVPVPTFFAATTNDTVSPPLDIETQTRHSLWLVKNGIQGLVILGSTGEAVSVRRSERHELLASQRKALNDAGYHDRDVIAGTATANIEDTLELIADSKTAGATYAMVLGPGYFAGSTTQTGIRRWFEAVADKSVLPILIYHYPGVTNNLSITPATFAQLAAHPNIVGTKLTHPNLDDATLLASSPTIDHTHFSTFTGLGQNLIPVLSVGGAAAIDALAGIFPRVLTRIYHGWLAGGVKGSDIAELRALQFKVCQGAKLIARWGPVGTKEALARVWGYGDGKAARLPLAGGFEDAAEWEKWVAVFEDLKRVEEGLEVSKV